MRGLIDVHTPVFLSLLILIFLSPYIHQKSQDHPSQNTPIKPMSHREQRFAQKHAIFLLRNIKKVRQIRQQSQSPDQKHHDDDYLKETGML